MTRHERAKTPFKPWMIGLLLIAVIAYYLLSPGGKIFSGGTGDAPDADRQELLVCFLDVGQGDCFYLRQGEAEMLIDTGPPEAAAAVIDFLDARPEQELDVVVLTHAHADHIGNAPSVLNRYPVGTVYMPDDTSTTRTYEKTLNAIEKNRLPLREAKAGVTFTLGEARAEFVGPVVCGDDSNNNSAVLRVTFGDTAFLFTADAKVEEENDILASGADLRADVLKIGHHGSYSSTSPDFFQAVRPQTAVISLGADNDYGYPHRETMALLREADIPVYRTDENGSIYMVSDGKTVTVTTTR